MAQSTKLFVFMLLLFVMYTTMNGHLSKYLRIVFGGSNG